LGEFGLEYQIVEVVLPLAVIYLRTH